MLFNCVGPFIGNFPFGTEIAFAKGLRRIGHEVIEVDPNSDRELRGLRNDADATIVFKSCVGAERFLKSLRHPIVVYQPDDARFPHIREMMLMMREYSDLFLSFDEYGAAIAHDMGYRAAEILLLTADDELYCPSPEPVERDIDVSFIGSLGDQAAHASRRRMCEIAQHEADKHGWKTAFGTTQDIPIVIDIYRRSKVVLNHATDVGQGFGWGHGVQCRHFEVGMTGTTLLSNAIFGMSLQQRLQLNASRAPIHETFSNEIELIEQMKHVIEFDKSCIGASSLHFIKKFHMPEHRAAKLVDFIVRNS